MAILALLSLFDATVLSRSRAAAAPGAKIRYAWAQLVSVDRQTKVAVRVIVPEGAGCGDLARYTGSVAAVRFKLRPNARRDLFPIDLCQAVLGLDDAGVALSNGTELSWASVATHKPQRVAIIGDTGCRKSENQICSDDNSWPLSKVAAAAASFGGQSPDLIIHVGDYRYRGTDTWTFWQKDFFEPMRSLLTAAPIVLTRGNHDNCYHGKGFGWKYLLAPTVQFENCSNEGTSKADVEWPYAIDLGKLRIVVLDSADSYYRCESWDTVVQAQHGKFIKALKTLIGSNDDSPIWFVSHYPIFDLRPSGDCGSPYDSSFFPLHKRIAPLLAGDPDIEAVISGDIHHYEALRVRDAAGWQTLQFVAGHGGAKREGLSDILKTFSADENNAKASDNRCKSDDRAQTAYCEKVELDNDRGYARDKFEVTARLRKVFGFLAATWDKDGGHWQFQMQTVPPDEPSIEPACQVPAGQRVGCVAAPKR